MLWRRRRSEVQLIAHHESHLKSMTMSASRLYSLLAGLCLFSSWAAPLNAWNKPGQMVTAAIAYDELTASDKTARDKVLSILREHPETTMKPLAERRAVLAAYLLVDLFQSLY